MRYLAEQPSSKLQESPSSTISVSSLYSSNSRNREHFLQQQGKYTTHSRTVAQQRMDHPPESGGPTDSQRQRSAAAQQQQQRLLQQQQLIPPPYQQQQQQQILQDQASISTTAAIGTSSSGRRRVAQERYLAAVAASSSSGPNTVVDPRFHHASLSASQQNQQASLAAAAQLPPVYSVGAPQLYASQQEQLQPSSAATTTNNMNPGVVAYPPNDPYHRQSQQQLMYQQQQGYPRGGVNQQLGSGFPYYPQQQAQQQQQAMTPRQPPLQQQQQQPHPHYHPQQQQLPHMPPAQHIYEQHGGVLTEPGVSAAAASLAHQQQHAAALAHPMSRLPSERPLIKLSVSLIDTYKHINNVYYEERNERRKSRDAANKKGGSGANNNGWDDENYDYIITANEVIFNRYKIKERIGKGSFGQVVRAEDLDTNREVAIKIIKSKKPFLMQAKTEIELLTHLCEKDTDDQHNIVRLLTHFMYRNHQCLVFEMLSLNLYELLKNTQFGGVSLNLIRKFAKQVLRALSFLARPDVDVIHCDLKPENILLRHPKKSGVKVIDFGSSCRSNKRMYSYIQSRFYRSPEVMLGLPYSVAIDMWSLGCILVEMHTGEPLFSGSDQFDQMQKIVKILGMIPYEMLDKSTDQVRNQFFERRKGQREWTLRQTKEGGKSSEKEKQQQPQEYILPSTDPIASLTEVITAGAQQKKKYPPSEAHNSQRNYELFIDLVYKMLAYRPEERIKPLDALDHAFLTMAETSGTTTSAKHS